MAARWNELAQGVVSGPSHAELEERRWGPGGRAHFADPRPGDYPGRGAQAEAEPELEPELDALAALAQQIEDLRTRVAKYQAIVTAWDARVEREGIGGTLMLRLELKQLKEQLDKAPDQAPAQPAASAVVARRRGGRQRDARRPARVGRGLRPGALSRLHGPGSGLLGKSSRGRLGAVHAARRVGTGVRRRGEPGPAGRPDVARPVAPRRRVPPRCLDQVRRGRMPDGPVSTASLTIMKAPGTLRCRRPSLALGASLPVP